MKILIVDDSITVRKKIRKILEGGGYQVIEAEDGAEALRQMVKNQDVELITLDVEMPKLDGFKTCETFRSEKYQEVFKSRKNQQNLPIVFLTGNDNIEDRRKGFELGATDFIGKSFLETELLPTVDKILKPNDRLNGLVAMVVEDNAAQRSWICRFLQQEGVTVYEGASGEDALKIIKEESIDFDMFLIDYYMPGMNGEKLVSVIRNDLGIKDVPIVILTAETREVDKLRLFRAGITDYISKPFVKEEFSARLQARLEIRMLNKRLKDYIVELQELNKLKDDFLSACSHDLRTPLNSIIGFTGMLLEDDDINDEKKEMLKNVLDSGEFILEIISDILDLSKIQSSENTMKKRVVSLAVSMRNIYESFKLASVKKDIDLKLNNELDHDFLIFADPSYISRVFNNLLSNSVKFTPSGGSIEITIRNVDDSKASVIVSDTGIGIKEEDINDLFDRFTKTSRFGTDGEHGTGLGLSITKEIVSKHEGSIDVESTEGKGSTFTVTLPSCPADKL